MLVTYLFAATQVPARRPAMPAKLSPASYACRRLKHTASADSGLRFWTVTPSKAGSGAAPVQGPG